MRQWQGWKYYNAIIRCDFVWERKAVIFHDIALQVRAYSIRLCFLSALDHLLWHNTNAENIWTKLSGEGAFQPRVVAGHARGLIKSAYEDFKISSEDFPFAVTTLPLKHTAPNSLIWSPLHHLVEKCALAHYLTREAQRHWDTVPRLMKMLTF